jgi:hypothetical protein
MAPSACARAIVIGAKGTGGIAATTPQFSSSGAVEASLGFWF